jgi:anti-sigma regulatory factor (Ser/Thr protein kinase)
MNTMAPAYEAELHAYRVRLTAEPAAASEARGQVLAAICAWMAPVDADVAVLLTSELVTNAIKHGAGGPVRLGIQCTRNQLRVEVHDTSPSPPVLMNTPADATVGRGLVLVASLATEWDFYRTSAGKAVYFTLAFQPDPARDSSGWHGTQFQGNGHKSERNGRALWNHPALGRRPPRRPVTPALPLFIGNGGRGDSPGAQAPSRPPPSAPLSA